MKLQEYHAKTLLSPCRIAGPDVVGGIDPGRGARTGRGVPAAKGAGKVVIKAQVLVGGRGKAGGVKLAGSPDEAEAVAAPILGMDIKDITVRRVLVAPAADIVRSCTSPPSSTAPPSASG